MRGASDGAQAAARAERKGWLASLKDEALSFVKGDTNAPWAILAETVIGFVPVLGQVVDARDIIRGLVEVAGAPASALAWFNLITALIGLVPGGGDAAKRSLRAVKSGAVQVDELLDMIRRLYKGNPEKLLKEVLDVSALRRTLDEILTNPNFTRRLSPELRRSVEQIRANIGRQIDSFKREVDGWLAKSRKTSADANPAAKATPGTPAVKPKTQANAGSQSKGQHGSSASPNTPNAATQRTARFKSLANKFLGVMGEHMADYHCQDVKGWGAKVRHDAGNKNSAKLNDGGRLVALWPCSPRGRGIDAVWSSNGPKPYAVIEAKASYDPTKGIKALLRDAWDKTERGDGTNTPYGRNRRGGRSGSRGTAPEDNSVRQANGKVTQMSHGWIEKRLASILLTDAKAKVELLRDKRRAYTRHVQFFSIPHAAAHAEALLLLVAGKPVEHSFHATHALTREWGDNQIEQVVNDRADPATSRRRR